jgi:hypothetical protein
LRAHRDQLKVGAGSDNNAPNVDEAARMMSQSRPDAWSGIRGRELEEQEVVAMGFRRVGTVVASGALMLLTAGCRFHTELPAACVSYRTGAEIDGTIVVDLDAPGRVTPGQTFTITVQDVSVRGVTTGGEAGPQYPNGVLSVSGAVEPIGAVAVGEDVLSGGNPLPNTLTYRSTGHPGDTITVGIEMAQSFYGNFLFGDRYTCSGEGRLVASIPVVAPTP